MTGAANPHDRRRLVDSIRAAKPSSLARPASLLALDLTVYAALFAAVLLAPPSWWWAKPLLSAALGIAIARLFLIGHDACHGSYFPAAARWANPVAGRLVFLFSYTPYSTWEYGHNTMHHGFTNLRGKDYVYTPFARAEFDALPRWRRWLERVYRHPLGPGLHYGIEIWWKRLWFPRRGMARPSAVYYWDSLLTLAFLAAQSIAVAAAARVSGQSAIWLAVWAIAAPFAVWNSVMGFITYQQHTHPNAVWFGDRREWDPVAAQVHGTVHVQFPWPIGALLGNIMEHTAHHLDVTIPMFDLPRAQQRVEAVFPEDVTVVRWSLSYYLDCCRRCKLYDYAQRQWIPF